MALDLNTIKEIRERTGLSIAKIKGALEETGGDVEKALKALKTQGAQIAEKKASRATNQGIVESYIHTNKKTGVLVRLHCETDFVAKNEEFINLAHEIAMQVVSMKPENNEDLLSQPYIKDPAVTIKDLIEQHIGKLGENIQLGEFIRFEI